ncbi:MAG: extracellular solute-binding protein [Lachnospiraceae bacterium]|nr:extracellular solute-binding protein [Lachnospiraceae bacterium]
MKKKTMKKLFAMTVAAGMMVSSLAGCGNSSSADSEKAAASTEVAEEAADAQSAEAAGETEAAAAIDTSERVDLVYYVVGAEPEDLQPVQDRINEVLLEEINATVTFKYTSWTDWMNKYNMALSSGEDIDLIYTAGWTNYGTYVSANAFLPLNDLIDTCMPNVKEVISDEIWEQTKVDGNIYMVPANLKNYVSQGTLYRVDLCEKYDLPVPDTMEHFEEYLLGIKENEPERRTFLEAGTKTGVFGLQGFKVNCIVNTRYPWIAYDFNYGMVADDSNPTEMYNYWATDEFREDMKTMKRWADEGFWSKNIMAETASASFSDGTAVALTGGNPHDYMTRKAIVEKDIPGAEVGFALYADVNGVAYPSHPTGDGTAITVNSKNPERAAMALDLLLTNKELNQLALYGIEGEHYTLNEAGEYVVGPENSKFPYEGTSYGLKNDDYRLESEGTTELKKEIYAHLDEIASSTHIPNTNIYAGFVEDYSEYSAERAALGSVMSQYLLPIQTGLVDDVDAAIDEFLEKAEEAGLSKIQEGYSAQWKAYCEEHGYK